MAEIDINKNDCPLSPGLESSLSFELRLNKVSKSMDDYKTLSMNSISTNGSPTRLSKCIYCIENEYHKEVKEAFKSIKTPKFKKCICGRSIVKFGQKINDTATDNCNENDENKLNRLKTQLKSASVVANSSKINMRVQTTTAKNGYKQQVTNKSSDEISYKATATTTTATTSTATITSNGTTTAVYTSTKSTGLSNFTAANTKIDADELERLKLKYSKYPLAKMNTTVGIMNTSINNNSNYNKIKSAVASNKTRAIDYKPTTPQQQQQQTTTATINSRLVQVKNLNSRFKQKFTSLDEMFINDVSVLTSTNSISKCFSNNDPLILNTLVEDSNNSLQEQIEFKPALPIPFEKSYTQIPDRKRSESFKAIQQLSSLDQQEQLKIQQSLTKDEINDMLNEKSIIGFDKPFFETEVFHKHSLLRFHDVVPEMEEVTTTLINGKSGKPLTSINRTPRSSNANDLVLPPIGEYDMARQNSSDNENGYGNSKYGKAKNSRVDSGIAENDYNNNGRKMSPNNSDNGGIGGGNENVQTSKLRKNITSSTLNSYGQSSKHTSSIISGEEPPSNNRRSSNYSSNYNYSNNATSSNNKATLANRTNSKSTQLNHFTKQDSGLNQDEDYDYVPFNNSSNGSKYGGNTKENMKTTNNQQQQQQQQARKTVDHSKPVAKPRQNVNDQRSQSLNRQASFMTDTRKKTNQQYASNIKARNSFSISNTKKSNSGLLQSRPSTCATSQPQQPQTQTKTLNAQQANTQQNNKKDDKFRNNNNNNSNVGEFNTVNLETLDAENDEALHEQRVKNRINKWLDDVQRCSQNRPPSALSWIGENNAEKKSNDGSNNNKDDDFELSDYDSCDDQIIEYNRVVDKTFCVVYDD